MFPILHTNFLTYLSHQVEEELLGILLLVRAELGMTLPDEVLEH